MFNNVKAKKRLTQFIIAFVVICMSVTGSFLLLEDTIDKANAATHTVNVNSVDSWRSAVTGKSSGDIVNITLTGDISAGALLQAIPTGVTVNLSMNGKTIAWDTVATSTASIMDENYGDGIRTDFWGLITNNGILNITGTGTIRMQKVNYNYKTNGAKDSFATKSCAIVNNGTMTIGSGITVVNNTAMAANDQEGTNKYMDTFVYGCAIYNYSGNLTTSGKISSNVMGAGISVNDSNSYHYAFSYGIYGGNVTTKGGSVSSEAKSGSLMATGSCKEGNQSVSISTGIFSNAAKVLGDTTITSKTSTWDSPGGYDCWSEGKDVSVSTGVMYTGSNYPVIGASVDIDATFFCPGESEVQMYVPGTGDYYTVKNKTEPGSAVRRSQPIAGVSKNVNTIGDHTAEKTWNADGSFFGNENFDFSGNMKYYPEEAYFGGFSGDSYLENASAQRMVESGKNNNQTATGSFRSGVPGKVGTQYKVIYRYYNDEVNSSKLASVSPKYDSSKQTGPAVINVGGAAKTNGAIPEAGSSITFGSGGTSRNSYYYKLQSTTYEKVASATFANRSYDKKDDWKNNGTQMTGSVTMTTENTLVIYMNYVLKSPSAIRVVAGNNPIDQYTTTTAFSVNYTGKTLVPGTDFQLGIIDMGINTSVDTNDAGDDIVVTNVYDISGSGSGSGNDKTAVTYRYTTDQVTWNNGLPKDAGTYIIEVNVNADVTFAASGTYNRQATTQLVNCTISKANIGITGDSAKNGTYGSTYAELIPFSSYKASGLGSDQLEGSWSYSGINANAYPNAGQSTVHLVWTPTANTATANNYNSTTFAVALNVAKRNVSVNAGASTVVYGDTKPTYVISYENLAPCDEAKKAEWFATTTFQVNGADYKAGLAVGTYPAKIVDFGGMGDENNNFTLNTTDGTLQVTKRNIVYNAVAMDRDYNGSANVDVKLNYASGNYSNDVYDSTISTTGTMPAGADAGEGKQVRVDTAAIIIKNSENYNLVINNIDAILVNIAKATPTGVSVVADPSIVTYDSSKTLSTATTLKATSTSVPGDWTWKDGTVVPTVDVPKYVAVFTPADSVNYKTIEQEVIFTVEQKEVLVSVKDFSISYGDPVPAITGSLVYTGFTGNDTVNNIGANGGVDATTTYTRGSGIGEYPVTVISNLTATNYYFTAVNNKIVVNPRALKVTAMNQAVTYGDQVPELNATDLYFEGFYGSDNFASLGGMAVVNTTYTPGKGVGTYPITVTGYTATNYAIEFVDGQLTVNKAVLTVSPNNVTGVTYGADTPAYAANKLYSFSGFKGTDTAENVEITGAPAFSTGYQSGKNAGTYPVTVAVNDLASANYTFVGKEGTLTVGKATPFVTEVPGAYVINLDNLSKAVFDDEYVVVNSNKATMAVSGTFAFADGTIVPVYGSFAEYNAVFTPDDAVNYTTTTVRVGVEVKVREISGKPVIQGSAMSGSTLSLNLASMDPAVAQYYTIEWYADNAKISGANSTTYKLADSDIGKIFTVKIVANESLGFTGFAWTDPTSAVIQTLLETTAAQLSAVISDVEYDAMSHKVTVSIADGYNPEYFGDITVKYNGLTQAPVNAGTYIVTVDIGIPAEPSGGYPADTYYGPATGIQIGTFTITPATIDIKVQAADKVYDGTTDATVVIEPIAGLKDEWDDVRIAEGSKFAFTDARVGTDKEVKVTSMQLVGAQAGNYKINVLPVYASITQRTLYVRVTGVTKTYDNSKNIAVTFSNIEGYAPIDSASTVYLTNGTAMALSADAGTQNITDISCVPAGSSAANYVVEYVNADTATVVITPATPDIDSPVINGVEYDAAKTLQTIDLAPYTTSAGFWQFNDLTIVPTVSQKTYAATFKSTNKNYTDLVTVITVNVEPKAVLLTADDKSVAYGTKAPVFTITASGLTGEDTLADIGGSCTPVCAYAPGSSIGTYTINLNNALSSDNYIFTTAPGTLTVAPARINVTATAENKVYDGTADINVKFTMVDGKYGNDDVALSSTATIGQSATVNAGSTTVTYIAPILVGSKADNYELYVTPASGALSVEILKADIAGVTFPVDGKVEFGYDLRFATFTINGVGDGTFAFENAKNIVPDELGFYEYKVIFTPTDARNYNTQEAMVSLEVVKCVLDYVVGIAGTAQNGEALVVVTTGLPSMAENYIQYQWYRTDGTRVEAIEGATGDRYVATDDDVGYTLFVITFFEESDPYVFSDDAAMETVDGEVYGIIGQTTEKIKEVALSFWQRLINWIKRIIAAITSITIS